MAENLEFRRRRDRHLEAVLLREAEEERVHSQNELNNRSDIPMLSEEHTRLWKAEVARVAALKRQRSAPAKLAV